MEYDFKQHIHNSAVWTASRAVNRQFTKTAAIKYAIEKANLSKMIGVVHPWSQEIFDDWHRDKAHEIIKYLVEFDESLKQKATYGRAAKIIAVYLKTAVILPYKGQDNMLKLIHCPIDRIVLTNLYRDGHLPEGKQINWTQLDENEYWKLIDGLRAKGINPNWKLERYWSL